MKKKILVLAGCILASICTFTGCNEGYPKISVYQEEWASEALDVGIGNTYKYDRYTREDTKDGCSVTIYFKYKESDK